MYTVVLGIAEPQQLQLLTSELARNGRFQIVNSAPNAVITVDLAAQLQPDVIILSDLSQGTPGRFVLPDLARLAPHSKVIITIAGDPQGVIDPSSVAHAVADHDVVALRTALDSTLDLLDHPAELVEQRVLSERRMAQDWTKVFAERRVEVRRHTDPGFIEAGRSQD